MPCGRGSSPDFLLSASPELYAPPFGEWPAEEDERIFARIRESGARFVWVGLGCPKQELWLARNKERLPNAVYAGVGAAFSAFHAGPASARRLSGFRAPGWNGCFGSSPNRAGSGAATLVHNSLFLYGIFSARKLRGLSKSRPSASHANRYLNQFGSDCTNPSAAPSPQPMPAAVSSITRQTVGRTFIIAITILGACAIAQMSAEQSWLAFLRPLPRAA